MTQQSYYKYWGKAKREQDDGEPYHLLVYHSLDVAAACSVLLNKHHHLRKRLSNLMQLPESTTQQWCSFLLGIHDLGKFAETFQYLRPDLRKHFWPEYTVRYKNYSIRHDSLGGMVWQQHIKKKLLTNLDADELQRDWINESLKLWIQSVVGHHGYPPETKEQARRHFAKQDQEAAYAFFADWQNLMDIDFASLPYQATEQNYASWLLAGIAVICDWLGSDQDKFQYHTEESGLSLAEYWQKIALPTAEQAVAEAGLIPATPKQNLKLNQLFDYIQQPTPLQAECAELGFNETPQLFILEDVTGAGKTEAALMLAHRLISKGMAEGLYVGLPTMATANAMYERMAKVYLTFYKTGEHPSLILSHSARHLSERFRQTLLNANRGVSKYETDEESINAQCNRWLADNRKKALLADVGVGTIDQALLGIMPVRHQSLRLLGLINKVLILDEVHAYDAYTGELLKTLIQFHAALGGSIILLSATLTRKQREKLAQAFGVKTFSSQKTDIYPLLTRISTDNQAEEIAVETRDAVKREVKVQFIHAEEKVLEYIQQANQSGKSICWIRNTVPDARSAFETLKRDLSDDKLHIFHSRYTLHDRLKIEKQVLELFGKHSEPEQRNGQVLIATQVVEQSLDLDFDIMISDLAPIDLLIQRAGRLQRHNRDQNGKRLQDGESDQRGKPTLIVYSPEITEAPQDNWYKSQFPKADFVYPHTLVLWRTTKILQQQGGWFMPADENGKYGARDMLEYVYDDETDIPEGLEQRTNEAIADGMSKSDAGDFATLKLKSGYHKNNHWDEEARHVTRLGEESQTVYLAQWENGTLSPWINEGIYRWDLSSVRVNYKQLISSAPIKDTDLAEQLMKLKDEEKLFDDETFVLPLMKVEETWQGTGVDEQERQVCVCYDAVGGLELSKPE